MTLPRAFFDRPALAVAPDLLGRVLTRRTADGMVGVRLTEVEAYAGAADPGSHAFRGRTARNATMFGPPGHAYVYFTYGMHYCMNLVCGPPGEASAVLLRAGEVVAGIELARSRRAGGAAARQVRDRDLARGPARLTVALAVDRSDDGADVCAHGAGLTVSTVRTGEPVPADRVRTGPRTGVSGAGGVAAWRFWVAGEESVSPYRVAVPRRRPVPDSPA